MPTESAFVSGFSEGAAAMRERRAHFLYMFMVPAIEVFFFRPGRLCCSLEGQLFFKRRTQRNACF